MAKFDQQMSANHTWGVRWLRELSPQRNQAIGQVTPRRGCEKRTTRIRRWSASLSSVFGNTKLNALRVGWTQEDVVVRAIPASTATGAIRPPATRRWPSRRSPTSRPTPRRRASTTPTRSRTRSPGSCPNKRGDHDIKLGAQYEYIEADNLAQDNLNGTFTFGQNNAALRPQQSAHLSRSPDHPRARPGARLREGALLLGLRAGQVEADQPASRPRSASATTAKRSPSRSGTIRTLPT